MIDLNIVRREAERVVARRAHGVRVGVVSSYDPATHSVKLTMQPEGYQTGWVPIATMGIGNGFGIFCGPTNGDSVVVAYHESDKKTPIVIGRLPTNEETPIAAQSGEFVAQSAFSSFVKLLKDGSVAVQDKSGATLAFDGEGNITVTAKGGQNIAMGSDGDIILTDKSGATIELDGSGKISMTGKAGQSIVMDSSGDIVLTPTGAGKVKLGGAAAVKTLLLTGGTSTEALAL